MYLQISLSASPFKHEHEGFEITWTWKVSKPKTVMVSVKIRSHLDCKRGEGAAGNCLYFFTICLTFSLRNFLSEQNVQKLHSALTTLLQILSQSFIPFQRLYQTEFKSCPLWSVSTLWLGYCSCSCCWCQQEVMPYYLAPRWSLSPLCHHRVLLRLEEDDNGAF